jgi:hypothetical protein
MVNKIKQYISIFLSFSVPWVWYVLFFLVGKTIYYYWGTETFWQQMVLLPKQLWFQYNLLLAVPLFGVGLLVNYFVEHINLVFCHNMILPILILIGIDQIIQLLVVIYHDSINLIIIDNWLTIIPKSMVHSKEYISNAQKLPAVHLLSCLGAMVLGYVIFRFTYFFEQNRNILVISASFYSAGIVCSILTTVLYNYGYDYIKLHRLYIFDLKDFYLYLGLATLGQSILENRKVFKKIACKDILRYFKWEYTTWITLHNKFKKKPKRAYP